MSTPGRLLYGTSSWSERAWAGVFYPQGLPAGEQLAYYATQFATVEADVTYYRVPDARLVRGWQAKTPPGFELAAKFPRGIVHAGEDAKPDADTLLVRDRVHADLERFLSVMELLGPRCGPLVLQFPYFNREVFASAEPFLERLAAFLDALPGTFRYAVEVRNRGWIAAPLLELLRRRNVALVWTELGYMPHPADLSARHDLVTADFGYARLIGERKRTEALTQTFDRVVLDQSASLEKWARFLREALRRLPKVYAYANNHFAGFAPATIRDLARRLEAS